MEITHAYNGGAAGQWLRGNLHAHTDRSDGKRSPQAVLDDYAARGYGFLMISDHDIYTSAADHARWDARGMVLIPGNEVTRDGVHLLHVGAGAYVAPDADRQKVIDQAKASGGFVIVNHPNWFKDWDHCTQETLERWTGYRGIEIFNGTIGRLEGSQFATDRWDRLLSKDRRVWGFANDDSHMEAEDVGLGWNVVQVQAPTVENIVQALSEGRFYASTGVNIRSIQVNGTRIRIETDNAERIIASTIHQRRFAVVDQPWIEVDLAHQPKLDKYVRFECAGCGEAFAWTQPFFLS